MTDTDTTTPAPPDALPRTRLTCHAPARAPARRGEPCGRFLGHVPGALEFVTTAARAPADPDGDVWMHCSARRCGAWNRFRLVPLPPRPAPFLRAWSGPAASDEAALPVNTRNAR